MSDKRKRDKRARGRAKGLAKAKKARDVAAKPQYKKAKTDNGRRIQQMLIKVGWPVADYKDYVALFGTTLLDWKDRFTCTNTDGQPFNPDGRILLIHKSKLHGTVPDQLADQMWHPKLNCRVVKAGPQ